MVDGRHASEAGSVRSEGSRRSGRSGGSEASTATGHVARKVVVPMPSRDELGEAHTDPPLDRVTLAARQPDPAWTRQVPPGPDGRRRHLTAVWDMVLESRGVQGTFRISFPCPIVVRVGPNLPAGQERVGMFAYRLVTGQWRVQTGVSRTGEEGTVTTAGVFGPNVLTGWEQRRPEWADVAWLAMRVHVGRQRKMGVVDVIDVEEQDEPPTCPFHPTFLSRSAPASDLAVIEVGEQCMLFFAGSVHQLEVCKGDNANAESEIHFAMTGIAPPERPNTPWHLVNTAPAWRAPKCAKTGAWSITCPRECKVCLLVCLLCLLANWMNFT